MSNAVVRLVVEGSSMDRTKARRCRALPRSSAVSARRLDHAARQERTVDGRGQRCRPARSASTSRSRCRALAARCGAVVEIFTVPELPSAARPRFALHCVAEAQKKGGICGLIDARDTRRDPIYARKARRQCRDFLNLAARHWRAGASRSPNTLVRSGAVDILVIDCGRGAGPARAEARRRGWATRMPRPAGAPDGGRRCQALPASINNPTRWSSSSNQKSHEIGRHVRFARDHDRRQRAQFYASVQPRHPPIRRDQRSARGGRQSDRVQGGEEQARRPRSSPSKFDIMYGEGV